MTDRFTRFCAAAELPPGGKKHGRVNGKWVLVCNAGGRLLAVSGLCSHQEKPLWTGRVRNCKITCPMHGARFDLATGAALDLPATKPIATYAVREVDDWIEVCVPES